MHEALQDRRRVAGLRCCEHLLDFLCTGQLSQDGRAFDGIRALDLQTCVPCFGIRVVSWSIASAKIYNGDFECIGGVAGWVIQELTFWSRGYGGLREDFGKWKSEDGNWRLVLFKFVLEVSLVENVSFGMLDEEDYAAFMNWRGFSVRFKGRSKT